MICLIYLLFNLSVNSVCMTPYFSVSETKTSKHSFTVGKIEVYLSDIIGHGSEGTVVFK